MVSRSSVFIGIGVVVIIIIILGLLYSMYFSGFNTAQASDENVKRLAADVDTQQQRRYDLIPNLVESVKGYMQFERQTLQDLTQLRTQWMRTAANDTGTRVNLSNQI